MQATKKPQENWIGKIEYKPEKTGLSLTEPNQAISIPNALERYAAPSLEEKLHGYYEQQGLELPNFDRLDKVEQLIAFAEHKEKIKNLKEKVDNMVLKDIKEVEKIKGKIKEEKAKADKEQKIDDKKEIKG